MIKIKLTPSQIRDVIWPGGATIQEIIKQTGVKIDFKDDGTTIITAKNQKDWEKAIKMIREVSWQPQEGDIIEWTITRVEPYGVFVKLWKNKLWLCHISNLWPGFIWDPRMMFKEGQKIRVKIIKIDEDGKIQLKREV
jgi:polyribonucleotide nucleotidyltransferase